MAALMFTVKVATEHTQELSIPRPEHAPLIAKEMEVRKYRAQYLQFTKWENLSISQRVFLLSAVGLELVCCGFTTFLTSKCFKPFTLANSIGDDFEEGGLAGDV